MITPAFRALTTFILLLLPVGCERGADEPASSAEDPLETGAIELEPEIRDSVDPDRTTEEDPYREEEDSIDPLPSEIYYHLSEHDWYRRGRPLVYAGGDYLPEGPLAVFSVEAADSLGSYQGVTFYGLSTADRDRRPGAVVDTVWVPVFERYWQPFVRGGDAAPGGW